MKSSSIWLLNIAAASAIAILILLTYLGLDQVKSTAWFSERVEHTFRAINESEQLLAHVKEAESSNRGFMITSNETFLKTYERARMQYDTSLIQLRFLLTDNIHQTRRLAIFENLGRDKWTTMDENIRLQPTLKKQNLDANVLKGKAIMDAMQKVILEMQQEESKLLNSRLKARQREFGLAPAYLLILALLAVLLLVISAVMLNVELRRRRRTQKDLEKKIEALNRSNAELEQFAYVASHDLQEPLRKIRAFADRLVMRQRESLSEDGQNMLDKIAKSAERMQGLINDLLTYSRMVSKNDTAQAVNLGGLLEEVKGDLSLLITEKNAEIISDELPTLMVYPTQIRQLFLNLLSNALKFQRLDVYPKVKVSYRQVTGADIPHLDTDLKKEQSYHRIQVADNGIGFEPEYAEKIFVIFQRLHAKTSYGGTGIGLAICRRVVSNHEGYIFAEGKPGEGAIFTVYFPLETINQELVGTFQ